MDASLEAIEKRVRKRAGWIRRQQRYFMQFLPRTPDRQFIAGETFRYLGRHYRLKVVQHVQALDAIDYVITHELCHLRPEFLWENSEA